MQTFEQDMERERQRRNAYEVGRRLTHHSGTVWEVTASNLSGQGQWEEGMIALEGDYRIKCIDYGLHERERDRSMRVHADYLHGDGWRS